MRRAPLALLVTLLVTLLPALENAPPALAGEEPKPAPPDPSRVTLRDLYGGGRRFTKAIPGWDWRPGHAQLVRTESRSVKEAGGKTGKPLRRPPRQILVTMDPASGERRDLLDLGSLDALVPLQEPGPDGKPRTKPVRSMRGIGRSGAPRLRWAAGGQQLCAVVRGDLVWVDLLTGERRRLTHTPEPLADLNIAPDGRHVSFSRGNELWVVSTTQGKPYPLTKGGSQTLLNGTLDWVYPEELDFRTAAWWSDDGEHIAYLQMDQSGVPKYRVPALLPLRSDGREMFYPKAGDKNPAVRVGVVRLGSGETHWLDLAPPSDDVPAAEYVARVGWDGPALYVLTLDRLQQHLVLHGFALGSHAVGAEAAGVPRRFLAEELERDDAWVGGRSLPESYAGGVTVLAKGDGARRWYRRRRGEEPGGDTLEALTPVGVDARSLLRYEAQTGRCLYQGTPVGSAVQGVFVGGPGVKKLVRAPFAENSKLSTSARVDEGGTYALVTTSSAVTPTRVVLARVADGEVIREIGNACAETLDELDLAVPEYGTLPVKGMEGKIRWRLWTPHDFKRRKKKHAYGLIVQVYGGPGSRMVNDRWGRGPLLPTLLCQRGFLVLQVDGRGTGGQGRAWMKCVYGRLGLLELEDQCAAVQHILKRGTVDPARVGIWGWSYGGTMACNALTMRSDVFKAGVAVASVTDWRLYDTIYTERYMGLPKDNPKGYSGSSPITHAKKMTGRLLLMHGLGDDNVHAQNTLRLVEAFLGAKKLNYETMLYPKRGHGIGGASLDVFTRLVSFFEEHLPAR